MRIRALVRSTEGRESIVGRRSRRRSVSSSSITREMPAVPAPVARESHARREVKTEERNETASNPLFEMNRPHRDDDPSAVSQHGWLIVKPWSNPQRVATRAASPTERENTALEGGRCKIAPRNRCVILYNRDSPKIMRATRDDRFVFPGG